MQNSVLLVIFCTLAASTTSHAQNSTCLSEDSIQDLRLVDGTFGDFMGRVEIRVNGTWGTICDNLWGKLDADVVCRTLGYEESVCGVTRARFGSGPRTSPIWMSNVNCFRAEHRCLQDCSFTGLDSPVTSCSHNEDAGVICAVESQKISPPGDLTLINSTTVSLAVRFSKIMDSDIPTGGERIRYRLSYVESDTPNAPRRNRFYFPTSRDADKSEITVIISNLRRSTNYDVQLSVDYRYGGSFCFSYVIGSLSEAVTFATNDTARVSMIPVRFTANQGNPEFMGRVEVQYNGTWGTVCDDRFSTADGNVICRKLGYSRALCVPSSFTTSLRTGPNLPILLDELNCPLSAEILEECTHNGWGNHNCRQGRDEAVVVCEPENDYLEIVSGVIVTDIRSTSAVVTWELGNFPTFAPRVLNQYRVNYFSQSRGFTSRRTVMHPLNQIELSFLTLNDTYTVTVQRQIQPDECFRFSTFAGTPSEPVNFTTIAFPPEGPPIDFHVIALNSTAIEVQWKPPVRNLQNGEILGYTVFVKPENGDETSYDFLTNDSSLDMATIINDLMPSTEYVFQVLAFNTGGIGPRTLLALTASTYAPGEAPVISRFGINADGLDSAVSFNFRPGFQIHCGTGLPNVLILWLDTEGNQVREDRGRSGLFQNINIQNKTTILNLATSRRLNTCDGGVYSCIAINQQTEEILEKRNFSLTIGVSPERMNRPSIGKIESTSVEITWRPLLCTGGHNIIDYNLRQRLGGGFFGIIDIIYHIEETSYTVTNLAPATQYSFSIQAVDDDGREGRFSLDTTVVTLPPAPTPPRDVSFRKVAIDVIEISWREPSNSNGVVVLYTVYLIPAGFTEDTPTKRRRRNVIEPEEIIRRNIDPDITSVNITLPVLTIAYTVQVTASIYSDEDINESPPSMDVVVPIPDPEIPVVEGFRQVSVSNSSITLEWEFIPLTSLAVDSFHIECMSTVETLSIRGEKISFEDTREIEVPSTENRVTLEPVTPGTLFHCDISAVTDTEIGEKASIVAMTLDVASGRVAYLQLKFGPVGRCSAFQNGDSEARLKSVKVGVINELNRLCKCGLTIDNLQDNSFSCANGLVDQIVYRARIIGNSNYNARDLVLVIDSWAASDNAELEIGSFAFKVDSQCNATLDTLHSPDCSPTGSSDISVGEMVTLVVTLLMITLLLVIVILLSVIFFRKRKVVNRKSAKLVRLQNEETDAEEDRTPFADLDENSNEKFTFEEQISN